MCWPAGGDASGQFTVALGAGLGRMVDLYAHSYLIGIREALNQRQMCSFKSAAADGLAQVALARFLPEQCS